MSDNDTKSSMLETKCASELIDAEDDEEEEEEEVDTHTCAKCKIVFTKLDDYIQHKLSKDNCRVKYTKSRRVLIPHLVSKEKKQYVPKVPTDGRRGRPGRKRGSKQRHIDIAHNKDDILVGDDKLKYKCMDCDKAFGREAALKRHVEFVHTKQSLDSEDEGDVEEMEEGEFVPGEEEVEDEFRPAKYHTKSPRTRTTRGAAQGVTFLTSDIVMKTEKASVGDAEKPFACAICGRAFKDMNILKAHFLTHSEERDFMCEWEGCNYAFKTKGSLKRHMRRHTGERPYVCNKCGRAFGESGALTRHNKARVPCTQKGDDDFPRYGKKMSFEMKNAAANSSQSDENQIGDIAEFVTTNTGQNVQFVIAQPSSSKSKQVATHGEVILADGTTVPSVTVISVKSGGKTGEGETVVIDTSGIDGHAGEEEVVAEAVHGGAEEMDEEGEVGEFGDEVLDAGDFTCNACNSFFEEKESLKTHLKSHLAESPFRCGLCTYASPSKDALNSHMMISHQSSLKSLRPETSPDDHQEETLVSEPQELILTQTPEGITIQTTSEVPEQIIQQDPQPNPLQHKSTKDIEKQTNEATLALQQLLELRDSSEITTVVPNGPHGYKTLYKCPVCERSFRGNAYLRLHMRTHTGEKPHKCPHCPKFFSTRDTLSKHLTVHSDERNYKCGECGKMFKRISHVREHLKVHSNDRPFACTVCFKPFKTANACKVHMRTHSDALPFECHYCQKNFREKGSLERHLRTHTGEKPYRCLHCGRAFAEHGTLNRHLKAKVPCTKGLHLARTVTLHPGQHEHILEEDEEEEEEEEGELDMEAVADDMTEVTMATGEKVPTVLAEFSSVVADTQQYIIQPPEEQVGTEFVMVSSGGDADTIQTVQNVEVVTNIPEDAGEDMQEVQYIMVNQETNEFIILNKHDGTQLNLVPADDDTVTLPHDVTVGEDDVITVSGENAVQTLAMIQQQQHHHKEVEETVEMVDEGHQQDVVAEDGDTIYKAMMVANVVEEMETETIQDTEISVEGHS